MVSIPKVIAVISCGFVLCLGLSNAAMATDDVKPGQPERQSGQAGLRGEQDKLTRGHMITGEVLRVEGNDCLIKGQDGKEIRLHIDTTTLKARNIDPGERIEARVDDQNRVIAILSNPAVTDRRNDKE